MSQSECSCKNKNPEILEEGGNCICTDCKCHYYKRNDVVGEDLLQNKIRNYSMVFIGTSTVFYTIYIFCCEKHLYHLSI